MTDARWECSKDRRRRSPVRRRARDEPRSDPGLTGGKAAALGPSRGRRPRRPCPASCSRLRSRDAVDDGAESLHITRRCAKRSNVPAANASDTRRAQLIGRRGHRGFVDGRSVRFDHRDQRLRRVRRPRSGTCSHSRERAGARRPSDRGARPAADRAGVRRRDVRHRPGFGAKRPPSRLRRARRARASRERRGQRLAVRARARKSKRSSSSANDGPRLDRPALRRLVALSEKVAEVFGGPQDVEWAIGTEGTLWLLQSRPVTTEVRGVPTGPVYGPGPVAETFPEPLTELENDLWVPPLRDAVREAVLLAGAATPPTSTRARSSFPSTVTSPSTCDSPARSLRSERVAHRLNPVPAYTRMRGAWRVGRLRSALAASGRDACSTESMPISKRCRRSSELTSRQLIALLHRGRHHPARAARARDPHGHAHGHGRQPHDRCLRRAARARRGATGRPDRRGGLGPEPDRARARGAESRAGAELPPEATAIHLRFG